MKPALAMVAAYLMGAVPIGYIVGRAFGVSDIRRHGSGNIGATNVLRTAGRLPAALTLLGDILKGYLAVALGAWLVPDSTFIAVVALLVVVGNCWSVFLGFRGGKGVATGLGAMLRLVPLAVVPALVVWLAVALTFRYVSLASLTAAAGVPLAALLFGYRGELVLGAAAVSAIIVVRHRDNIARLAAGTERRVGASRKAA